MASVQVKEEESGDQQITETVLSNSKGPRVGLSLRIMIDIFLSSLSCNNELSVLVTDLCSQPDLVLEKLNECNVLVTDQCAQPDLVLEKLSEIYYGRISRKRCNVDPHCGILVCMFEYEDEHATPRMARINYEYTGRWPFHSFNRTFHDDFCYDGSYYEDLNQFLTDQYEPDMGKEEVTQLAKNAISVAAMRARSQGDLTIGGWYTVLSAESATLEERNNMMYHSTLIREGRVVPLPPEKFYDRIGNTLRADQQVVPLFSDRDDLLVEQFWINLNSFGNTSSADQQVVPLFSDSDDLLVEQFWSNFD